MKVSKIPFHELQRAVERAALLDKGRRYFTVGRVLELLPYDLSPGFDIQALGVLIRNRYQGKLEKRRTGGWYLF